MAKKAKGESKSKRKKAPVTNAATRRKTMTSEKPRRSENDRQRRLRPGENKEKPSAEAALRTTAASSPAHPGTPTPSLPTQRFPPAKRVAATRYYIYVTRGGDTREFFWEAKDEEEARVLVGIWNQAPGQFNELYFVEPYEGDGC